MPGDYLDEVRDVIVAGRHKEIENIVQGLIDKGVNLNELINEAMIPAMDIVGQRFARREIFVPEMLVSALAMQKGLALIKPLLKGDESKVAGTVVLCTVKGDIHDIGKNLVGMMLEGGGFKVVDLGVNLSVDDLLTHIKQIRPDILGLSALLTTTMPEMGKVIQALADHGLRDSVKVMVGGAPVDRRFADSIGADAYGEDALEAVRLAREFIT